jgi:methionyl-tRNA synthetase
MHSDTKKLPKRYTITAALPYTNGPVHIGHLAGVYIPADIYARYLRLQKREVIFVCGSDENGIPITLMAKKQGISPQQLVDKFNASIGQSFKDFGISFDIYHRTSSKIHHETASEFFKTLYDKGLFEEKVSEQFYDAEQGQFLADRYIQGTCPNCGFERAYGDQCENCGTSLSPLDLINPRSMISGNPPILKETKHWYLPLQDYQKRLEKYILEDHRDWKTNVFGQCKSWLDQGLESRAVTRDLDWGIPVPIPGAEGKVLYVWFDAPIGYISATKALRPDWEKFWKDPETRLIHFLGKDNIVFHAIIFPAMLMAEGSYILADNVPANEFLNLEGEKISTSRNWAVWLDDYLLEFPEKQDVLRYVLTATCPETKDNDFTWKDFQARNNNELVANFGNFTNRVLILCQKYYEGRVPKPGPLSAVENQLYQEIENLIRSITENLESFRFREALAELMNLTRLGNRYLAETEPWKLGPGEELRRDTILYTALQILGNLSILAGPFLPHTVINLQTMLNLEPLSWDQAGRTDFLREGHILGKPQLLFDKIENEIIEFQIEKLQKSKLQNQNPGMESYSPLKPEISFDQFSEMDIRVGTIVDAVKIPKANKLLKLSIDIGSETRTVVSGIAEQFDPLKILGTQVSILVNLAPRMIKGVESYGMILMAENPEGKLSFLSPESNWKEGSIIR